MQIIVFNRRQTSDAQMSHISSAQRFVFIVTMYIPQDANSKNALWKLYDVNSSNNQTEVLLYGEFNQTNLRTVLPQLCQLEQSLLDQLCRIRAETKVTPGVYSSKCSGSAPDSLLKSLPALSS